MVRDRAGAEAIVDDWIIVDRSACERFDLQIDIEPNIVARFDPWLHFESESEVLILHFGCDGRSDSMEYWRGCHHGTTHERTQRWSIPPVKKSDRGWSERYELGGD